MILWRADRSLLPPAFAADIDELLTPGPWTWYVLSGLRTMEEQAALHRIALAGGPRAAPPGRSAHNYGLAVDVALDGNMGTPGLQPDYKVVRNSGWLWLRDVIAPHPRLSSGWRYGDWPHIERFQWVKYRTAA